tara:strand:- start:4585 stop:5148 length:564 start_codon:yes stop_codon:yes gene_type:complete
MSLLNINNTKTRYTIHIDSRYGVQVDDSIKKVQYCSANFFNIDPKYTKSLIYVKYFQMTPGPADQTDVSFDIVCRNKTFPNNLVLRNPSSVGAIAHGLPTNGSYSQIIAVVPAKGISFSDTAGGQINAGIMMEFPGSVQENGILCGETFINGGDFIIEIIGDENSPLETAAGFYKMTIEVQLVENDY